MNFKVAITVISKLMVLLAYATAFAAHSYAFSLAMYPEEVSEPTHEQTAGTTQTPKEEEGDLDVQGGDSMGMFARQKRPKKLTPKTARNVI